MDFLESKTCYLCKEEIFPKNDILMALAPIQDCLEQCGLEHHKFPTSAELNNLRKVTKITMKDGNIPEETQKI